LDHRISGCEYFGKCLYFVPLYRRNLVSRIVLQPLRCRYETQQLCSLTKIKVEFKDGYSSRRQNSAPNNCKFYACDLQILRNLRTIFVNCAQHFNPFFLWYIGVVVCDTGVLSRVWWLVGPFKLRVTIQLTLCLRLLKMLCD